MKCKTSTRIIHWLVLLGAFNWGLIGLGYFFGGNWNVISLITGQSPVIENAVYILIGISAIIAFTGCKKCEGCSCKV